MPMPMPVAMANGSFNRFAKVFSVLMRDALMVLALALVFGLTFPCQIPKGRITKMRLVSQKNVLPKSLHAAAATRTSNIQRTFAPSLRYVTLRYVRILFFLPPFLFCFLFSSRCWGDGIVILNFSLGQIEFEEKRASVWLGQSSLCAGFMYFLKYFYFFCIYAELRTCRRRGRGSGASTNELEWRGRGAGEGC